MKLKPISSIFAVSILALFLSAPVTAAEGKDDPSVMKREQDGVSKKEFMKHHQWMFEQNDKNQNGYLDDDEMRSLHKMVKEMHGGFDERSGRKKIASVSVFICSSRALADSIFTLSAKAWYQWLHLTHATPFHSICI